jgi:hypothetical protein
MALLAVLHKCYQSDRINMRWAKAYRGSGGKPSAFHGEGQVTIPTLFTCEFR